MTTVPGQIVKLEAEQPVPADLLFQNKTCVPELVDSLKTDVALGRSRVEIEYEPPNSEIYKFNGVLRVHQSGHDFPHYAAPPQRTVSNVGEVSSSILRSLLSCITCGFCCRSRRKKKVSQRKNRGEQIAR
eukprot:Selendium_serpulae@DN6348_c2_g3_i1.p4